MPDLIASVTATPGLMWLLIAALVAGIVRGFSGFGTAMIYLPVAGQFLSPFEALTTMVVMDMIGPLPNVPRSIRDGHPRDVMRMAAGMMVALPLGVFALTQVAPEVFRYGVSLVTLILLALLVSGLRYHGTLTRPMIYGSGALSGLLAGSVGLAGPPVIMLYMASARAAHVVRANLMLYLILADIMMLLVMAAFGQLIGSAIGLGLMVAVPYLIGNMTGAWMFRPGAERVYRSVAYLIIAVSALSGLPFFD